MVSDSLKGHSVGLSHLYEVHVRVCGIEQMGVGYTVTRGAVWFSP